MPKVFINYRSGDGDHLAATLEQALTHRFGAEQVFKDGTSIRAGSHYPDELLQAVRTSSVLLAAVGPYWSVTPDLGREDDWVRRELLEARRCGVGIVPVLDATAIKRVDAAPLPPELGWFAELQALRYAPYSAMTDLDHLADELVRLVPELLDTRPAPPSDAQPRTSNIYKGNQGAFHSGQGDQRIEQSFGWPSPDEDGRR